MLIQTTAIGPLDYQSYSALDRYKKKKNHSLYRHCFQETIFKYIM